MVAVGAPLNANNAPIIFLDPNTIDQRNGANPQLYRLYNLYVDTGNFERADLVWSGNEFVVQTSRNGSGVARNLRLSSVAAIRIILPAGAVWQFTPNGHLLLETDNVNDIGANGSNRPRSIYAGTQVIAPNITQDEANITNLQGQMTTANTNISTLQSQMATANNNISALQADNTTNKNNIATLQNQMVTANNNISSISAKQVTDEANIAQNTSDITTLKSQVTNIQSQIDSLSSRLGTAESAISNLDSRVTALETGHAAIPVIGSIVHLRDELGHCQPAVIYENWTFINGKYCMSVAVIQPERLDVSPWLSKVEVEIEPTPIPVGKPFNYWHWPEQSNPPTRVLFERINSAHIR